MRSSRSKPGPLRLLLGVALILALTALVLVPRFFLRSSITVQNRSSETIETVRFVVTTLAGPVEREKTLRLASGEDREWRLPAFTDEARLDVEVETANGRAHAECGAVELNSYHFLVVLYDDQLRCTIDS